jgi:hypothetical protein
LITEAGFEKGLFGFRRERLVHVRVAADDAGRIHFIPL